MAQTEKTGTLVRLSDTDLTVANPAEDIRNRNVVDRNNEEIGDVNDLFIDNRDKRVRFLEVAGTPAYDPDLIHEEVGEGSYYGDVYRHYGYPPYWGPGYAYPPYPYYP